VVVHPVDERAGQAAWVPCRSAIRSPARVVVAWKASPAIGVRRTFAR
jgi:hypothetical protein